MKLFLSYYLFVLFKSLSVNPWLIGVYKFRKLSLSLFDSMFRVFIYSILQAIYDGNPGKHIERFFDLSLLRSFEIFSILIKRSSEVHTHKFHTHRCNLSNLHRIMIENTGNSCSTKTMHCVSSFMHKGMQIILRACCIHKNKWVATYWHRTVISPRSFPLS